METVQKMRIGETKKKIKEAGGSLGFMMESQTTAKLILHNNFFAPLNNFASLKYFTYKKKKTRFVSCTNQSI